jgi:hypothetical protein
VARGDYRTVFWAVARRRAVVSSQLVRPSGIEGANSRMKSVTGTVNQVKRAAIGWLVLASDVLRRRKTIQVTWLTCRELVVETRRARPWQVDGDVIGFGRRLVVRVRPASLLVRVPAGPAVSVLWPAAKGPVPGSGRW